MGGSILNGRCIDSGAPHTVVFIKPSAFSRCHVDIAVLSDAATVAREKTSGNTTCSIVDVRCLDAELLQSRSSNSS